MFNSRNPPKILTRARAMTCVAMNQLAFPGVGTVMAGRRIGYIQAVLMLSGFLLATGFMLWAINCSVHALINGLMDEEKLKAQYLPYAWMGKLGFGLCLVAWFWSLGSSFGILRQVPKSPPAFPVT